jgi:hypothetical protein
MNLIALHMNIVDKNFVIYDSLNLLIESIYFLYATMLIVSINEFM